MIDVFVELPLIEKGIGYYRLILGNLDKFKINVENCLLPEKKCEYPNIRFHNTDIRQTESKDPTPFIMDFFMRIIDIWRTIEPKEIDYNKYRNQINNLLEFVTDMRKSVRTELNNITTHEQLLEYLMKIYGKFKLKKQLEHIST